VRPPSPSPVQDFFINHDAVASVMPSFDEASVVFTRASQPMDRVLQMWNWTTGELVVRGQPTGAMAPYPRLCVYVCMPDCDRVLFALRTSIDRGVCEGGGAETGR
jgi:hypothetical protein